MIQTAGTGIDHKPAPYEVHAQSTQGNYVTWHPVPEPRCMALCVWRCVFPQCVTPHLHLLLTITIIITRHAQLKATVLQRNHTC
jgi:hypothetical protein